MYYCIRTLPVTVAEVPVGPTDNSKKKMNPAAKEAGDFSENEGGVLPGFMMESYQVRFQTPNDNKNTVIQTRLSYKHSYVLRFISKLLVDEINRKLTKHTTYTK